MTCRVLFTTNATPLTLILVSKHKRGLFDDFFGVFLGKSWFGVKKCDVFVKIPVWRKKVMILLLKSWFGVKKGGFFVKILVWRKKGRIFTGHFFPQFFSGISPPF